MDQVREHLSLIKEVKMNDVLVAASFIVRRFQPYKERAHPGFDFKGDDNGTRERPGRLKRSEVLERAVELFAPNASFSVSRQMRSFNCMNPPPQVKVSTI